MRQEKTRLIRLLTDIIHGFLLTDLVYSRYSGEDGRDPECGSMQISFTTI